MSIKKQAVKKDERKVNIMSEKRKLNGDKWQLERITEHSLLIKGNMVVLDRLEMGVLRIFELDTDDPAYIQYVSDTFYVTGATLVGEIKIDISLEEKGVLIKEIFCEKGHEELAKHMLGQVIHFVNFYDEFEKMGMVAAVHQKWGF